MCNQKSPVHLQHKHTILYRCLRILLPYPQISNNLPPGFLLRVFLPSEPLLQKLPLYIRWHQLLILKSFRNPRYRVLSSDSEYARTLPNSHYLSIRLQEFLPHFVSQYLIELLAHIQRMQQPDQDVLPGGSF